MSFLNNFFHKVNHGIVEKNLNICNYPDFDVIFAQVLYLIDTLSRKVEGLDPAKPWQPSLRRRC